jgi:serine/tyrosine/threonine adenylyltransferase
MTLAKSLAELKISNSFGELLAQFYTKLATQALNSPRLLHANPDAAALLGLDPAVMQGPEFLALVSGAAPLPGGQTLAALCTAVISSVFGLDNLVTGERIY